jgi:polysaccharide export outer membrane protein
VGAGLLVECTHVGVLVRVYIRARLRSPRPGSMMPPVGTRPLRTMILALTGVLALCGCKPKHPYVQCKDVPDADVAVGDTPLRAGDQVVITVPRMEELQSREPYTVTADGSVILPLVGALEVEGLTLEAAERKLNARLNGIVVNPDANVSVVNQRFPFVSVIGEVRSPGRFPMEHEEGLLAAIALAGGLTEFADVKSIYLVRKYPQRVRVRFNYYDLAGGVECPSSIVLRDGDVIVVE